MSTHTHLTNNPGQPLVLNVTEYNMPVNIAPQGAEAHWIYGLLRRPSREELLQREKESTIETKPQAGGSSLIITNDRQANINLAKKILLRVTGLTADGTALEADKGLFARLNSGWLNRFIQALYSGSAKLRWNAAMAFIDADQNALLYVDHEFGIRELPDFVVTWAIRKPDEITMADYRLNAQKVSTGGGGRRASSKLITDLSVAERVFKQIFAGVEGAVIALPKAAGDGFDLVTYSEDRRDEFIAAVDLNIQRDVVQCVMDYMEGQLQD